MNEGRQTEEYRKLIRNLRSKQHEELIYIRTTTFVSDRKEGKKGSVSRQANTNIRKE